MVAQYLVSTIPSKTVHDVLLIQKSNPSNGQAVQSRDQGASQDQPHKFQNMDEYTETCCICFEPFAKGGTDRTMDGLPFTEYGAHVRTVSLNQCLHKFCYDCIALWDHFQGEIRQLDSREHYEYAGENKSVENHRTCPLCRTHYESFAAIYTAGVPVSVDDNLDSPPTPLAISRATQQPFSPSRPDQNFCARLFVFLHTLLSLSHLNECTVDYFFIFIATAFIIWYSIILELRLVAQLNA
ncbi:uncharacterized protein LOC129600465 [Paramacrobiotus metropolitanus]|uniref:uncharacterized protein LOC129600465 n=1 Tax=Paramacrobiotus metropolitanus TaxID=2943436 RepID=UPI0024460766|nr:uncharacterized protein LOC129600465 [Paramacrobiotus metropolitanus]